MNKCSCGFEFSGPGEFRNCEVYTDDKGNIIAICPRCKAKYSMKD